MRAFAARAVRASATVLSLGRPAEPIHRVAGKEADTSESPQGQINSPLVGSFADRGWGAAGFPADVADSKKLEGGFRVGAVVTHAATL